MAARRNQDARCSFCGIEGDETRHMVAGPVTYICTECIALCNDILTEGWGEGATFPTLSKLAHHFGNINLREFLSEQFKTTHTRDITLEGLLNRLREVYGEAARVAAAKTESPPPESAEKA